MPRFANGPWTALWTESGEWLMPIYEYKCESCLAVLEKLQKISDAPLRDCPECGKETLVKLVSAPSFRLKGSGWYETDFKTGKKKNGVGTDGDGAAKSGADEAANTKNSESKNNETKNSEAASSKSGESAPAPSSSKTSSGNDSKASTPTRTGSD
jgi:putative FmdB family regulatory protein